MSEEKSYYVLAYYHFCPVADPALEVRRHKEFLKDRDATCRIYISEEGINGQFSAFKDDAIAYMEWMKADERFSQMPFKIHYATENIYPRLTIKTRKQLVAIDCKVDMANTGVHLSPSEWADMMDKEPNKILIDTRNDYEWEVGHFDNSELPNLQTFRQFPQYAEDLKSRIDPENTTVMMCCTGGIRCEIYSALMKEKGFKKVYQLDGGIINYGLKEGNRNWKGKLFVFDDRLAVPLNEDAPPAPVISSCKVCHKPSDTYYNCANMHCNDLFICCKDCLPTVKGCCCIECQSSPGLRPLNLNTPYKPFRRKHMLNG